MKIIQGLLIVLVGLLAMFLIQKVAASPPVTFTITPSVVSNTYFGPVVLQVTGLTNSETVVVQKYLDANTNGVVDAGDWLWQQFTLTDGKASVFTNGSITVTNFNVPCDMDGVANGSITAELNQSADFAQRIVGKYLFVLSSPVGHFPEMTTNFAVTNFPFPQKFTGNVVSNETSTTVTDAVVFIGAPDSDNNLNFFAGTVANNSGVYSIQVPPGRYMLVAVRSNYVGNVDAVINQFLLSGMTINTNLNLILGTRTISGKYEDATNSNLGIPGFLQPMESQSGSFTFAVTDTNGNFSASVTPDKWGLAHGNEAMMLHGYLTQGTNPSPNTTSGNVTGLTIALNKATALYYGNITDTSGNPLPGVWVYDEDSTNEITLSFTNAGEGVTDINGHYVAAATGVGNMWLVGVDNSLFFPEYSFSGSVPINIGFGKAVPINFTAAPAVPGMSAQYFANGQFQLTVSGVAGVNETLQMSTNLLSTNWIALWVTNLSGSSFTITDTNATNQQSFYRVLVGPLNW